jgi:hypothetical protein
LQTGLDEVELGRRLFPHPGSRGRRNFAFRTARRFTGN